MIGTHRLLQKDVHFHNLGLLIIDEEHRFGVKHKERLKELKKQVDVLTLSATPIPRTLAMTAYADLDTSVIDELKRLEHEGYHFEAADGSLELLMRRATGWVQPFFELESYRVIVAEGEDLRHDTEAIVKLLPGVTIGDGAVVGVGLGAGQRGQG